MKKFIFALTLMLLITGLIGCDDGPEPEPEPIVYTLSEELPSLELCEDETNPGIVPNAPDLLILGLVCDTHYWYHYENLSGWEYLKVYNNTSEPYNLKNHRVMVANPTIGQNTENEATRLGDEVLCTGYVYMSFFDEDFYIPAKSIGLIWLSPYYWTAGAGTNAVSKEFSTNLIYRDTEDSSGNIAKGAVNQTIEDFRDFWSIGSSVPIYKLNNSALLGIGPNAGTPDMFPLFNPASAQVFTHMNSSLLRSIEIQKFDDNGGTATTEVLNKYSELSDEKKADPDLIGGKQVFNVLAIREGGSYVDAYLWTNAWKYWEPVVRINFLGRVDTNKFEVGQTEVDFLNTNNPGMSGWPHTIELQFRPPIAGQRIMQWQVPTRDYTKYVNYLKVSQLELLRLSTKVENNYQYIWKDIKFSVDPTSATFATKSHTIMDNPGRFSCAAPDKIKKMNLTRP